MLSNSWETSCRSLKYWTALQICMSWRKKFGNYLDTSHIDTQHSSDPPAEELSHGHAFIVIDHNKDRISRSVTMQFCLFGAFDGDKNHEHEQKITRTNESPHELARRLGWSCGRSAPFLSQASTTYNLLMQGFTSRHHWVHVLRRNNALHHDWAGSVVFQELLHHCWEVCELGATHRLGTHRFGELGEVGVVHPRVRISVLVEQVYSA